MKIPLAYSKFNSVRYFFIFPLNTNPSKITPSIFYPPTILFISFAPLSLSNKTWRNVRIVLSFLYWYSIHTFLPCSVYFTVLKVFPCLWIESNNLPLLRQQVGSHNHRVQEEDMPCLLYCLWKTRNDSYILRQEFWNRQNLSNLVPTYDLFMLENIFC